MLQRLARIKWRAWTSYLKSKTSKWTNDMLVRSSRRGNVSFVRFQVEPHRDLPVPEIKFWIVLSLWVILVIPNGRSELVMPPLYQTHCFYAIHVFVIRGLSSECREDSLFAMVPCLLVPCLVSVVLKVVPYALPEICLALFCHFCQDKKKTATSCGIAKTFCK